MNLPRMSLHVGDYLKDTGHLRAAEHGAYLLMIMHYWTTGGLPNDDRQLAAIARMTDREWKTAKPVLAGFFKEGWRHNRIDEELADAVARYERRASAGKQGGKAKASAKQCPSNARSMLPAMQKQPTTLTLSSDEDDGGGAARAREPASTTGGLISAEACELVEEILSIAKLEPDHPMAIGGAYEVQAWLNGGASPEIIRIAVQRSLANKRDGPPTTFKYFAKAVAREKATAGQALPEVEISGARHERSSSHRPNSLAEAARKRIAEIDQWDAEQRRSAAGEAGLRNSGPHVRLLSPRGSG